MARLVAFEVPEASRGIRLDRFLAGVLPGESREAIQRWIHAGAVRREGGGLLKPASRLRPGDRIRVEIPDSPPGFVLQPEPIPLDVVHADAELLVVVKPAGMVVHPGAGARTGTLVHALLGGRYDLSRAGGADRPGIVHRLDKETSGLLVIARNDRAHRALAAQFAAREVRKVYLALVWGSPVPASGRIEAAIGRDPRSRTRMSVRPAKGRSALTEYRTCELLGPVTLLEIRLLTGRTHQIRVHLRHRGHPIVGDATYGGRRYEAARPRRVREALEEFGRMALHAARLEFVHPASGKRVRFEAPLPGDFAALLERLRDLRG
jgi:23S rRNA pseudouridine1911/1915/1917 synthase